MWTEKHLGEKSRPVAKKKDSHWGLVINNVKEINWDKIYKRPWTVSCNQKGFCF